MTNVYDRYRNDAVDIDHQMTFENDFHLFALKRFAKKVRAEIRYCLISNLNQMKQD